ncbi:hypothetical protein FOQG_08120 [Fusarium oxysporum f. sp. raphani 54005]|uniref:AB hydrolase-1 domain-containing protein n=2 Tax=Fusarium oxysporum f. sp. raphani TaxID=96318 RepID=X0D2D4_FUSOX|nr:hypothetical protein FOQG_08120 [Fusarium oxysporum f. sp. raphani 54005]
MQDQLPTQLYTTIDRFVLESGEVPTNATVASLSRVNLTLSEPTPSSSATPFPAVLMLRTGGHYFYYVLRTQSSIPTDSASCTASHYGHPFPKTTIRNDVRIQLIIVELLEVRSIYCVTGGSLGGMMALEWALLGKHFVRSMVLVATAARQSHWAIAWSENQLASIKPDSKFRGGRYGGDPPRDGLAAARMAAMISYRTHSSFEKMLLKVSGTRNGTRAPFAVDVQRAERNDGHYDNSGIFLAQSYLRYQGEKFNSRFDANCYLHILDKIDSHDIARVRYPSLSDDEAILNDLSQIRKPTLVVGVPTDGLYPPSEQIFLSQGLKNATFATLQSDGGHDAFLIQGEQLNELLRSFFDSDPDL